MTATERSDIPGTWVVLSGTNRYNVDLNEPSCDCAGWCWTEKDCKHLRYVRSLQ